MERLPISSVVVLVVPMMSAGIALVPEPGAPARSQSAAISDAEAAAATTVEELGRMLFWDPILSGERDVACATCHHPDFAYGDGRALSLGVGAVGLGPDRVDNSDGRIPVVQRNSQTILNTAFNGLDRRRRRRRSRDAGLAFDGSVESVDQARAPMFWDSRVRSLEAQALEPLKTREEMRGDAYPEEVAVDRVVARLRDVPEYVTLFEEAFGPGPLDAERLGVAIAAFERRLLAEPDAGDGRFRFRTPSLRNVALTSPYMHNGVLATLEEVLGFYDRGRSENSAVADGRRRGERGTPQVDRRFRRVDDMSEAQMSDIIAFLGALTDGDFDRAIPRQVPSGLPVGGALDAR